MRRAEVKNRDPVGLTFEALWGVPKPGGGVHPVSRVPCNSGHATGDRPLGGTPCVRGCVHPKTNAAIMRVYVKGYSSRAPRTAFSGCGGGGGGRKTRHSGAVAIAGQDYKKNLPPQAADHGARAQAGRERAQKAREAAAAAQPKTVRKRRAPAADAAADADAAAAYTPSRVRRDRLAGIYGDTGNGDQRWGANGAAAREPISSGIPNSSSSTAAPKAKKPKAPKTNNKIQDVRKSMGAMFAGTSRALSPLAVPNLDARGHSVAPSEDRIAALSAKGGAELKMLREGKGSLARGITARLGLGSNMALQALDLSAAELYDQCTLAAVREENAARLAEAMQGGGGGRTARIKAAQRQAAQISGHKRFMAGGNAEWLPKIKEMRLLEARPWKEIVAATYGGAKKAWSDKVALDKEISAANEFWGAKRVEALKRLNLEARWKQGW